MSDAPTIAERYRKATTASNLKVNLTSSGAVDLLIAAGWSDSLGITLYRLAGEYDQVAQDVRKAHTTTDALLILGKLKTLTQARAELVRWAIGEASRWGTPLDNGVCAILVGRALNAWLDPTCHKCGGTGTIGGYDGQIANLCRRCSGSGKSRHNLGKTDHETRFATRVLCAMDAKMAHAETLLRSAMR